MYLNTVKYHSLSRNYKRGAQCRSLSGMTPRVPQLHLLEQCSQSDVHKRGGASRIASITHCYCCCCPPCLPTHATVLYQHRAEEIDQKLEKSLVKVAADISKKEYKLVAAFVTFNTEAEKQACMDNCPNGGCLDGCLSGARREWRRRSRAYMHVMQ